MDSVCAVCEKALSSEETVIKCVNVNCKRRVHSPGCSFGSFCGPCSVKIVKCAQCHVGIANVDINSACHHCLRWLCHDCTSTGAGNRVCPLANCGQSMSAPAEGIQSRLKIGFINMNSLWSNLGLFKRFLYGHDFDICAVCETMVEADAEKCRAVKVHGYTAIFEPAEYGKSQNKIDKRIHIKRGLAIYYKNKKKLPFMMRPRKLEVHHVVSGNKFEFLAVEFYLVWGGQLERIILCCTYLSGGSTTDTHMGKFEDVCKNLDVSQNAVVIMGDFNYNYTDSQLEENPERVKKESYAKKIPEKERAVNTTKGLQLTQIIRKTTRNYPYPENIIDHLYISEKVKNIFNTDSAGVFTVPIVSDHHGIFLLLELKLTGADTVPQQQRNTEAEIFHQSFIEPAQQVIIKEIDKELEKLNLERNAVF